MRKGFSGFLSITLILLFACGAEEEGVSDINALAITIDGSAVSDGINEVTLNPQIAINFDVAIVRENIEAQISIQTDGVTPGFNLQLTNADSRAVITLELEPDTEYVFQLSAAAIGVKQEVLSEAITIEMKTSTTLIAACTTASEDCLGTISFNQGEYALSYYANYGLGTDVELTQITNALILVHGANRNNDEYFTWMNASYSELSASVNTLLIAPQFKAQSETSESNELYWSSNNWREGNDTQNAFKISSFSVIDSLVKQITTKAPNVEKIVITGHSSGGLFTHAYAVANRVASQLDYVQMEYIVANSQYFYYPNAERVNEATNQFFIPSDCNGYDAWPLGFANTPTYLSDIEKAQADNNLKERNITYLLGNGNQSDPSLNTTACSATLLGSTRYQRGENIFFTVEQKFSENNSSRVIVEGIGHNGEAIYKSTEFKDLLSDLFNL